MPIARRHRIVADQTDSRRFLLFRRVDELETPGLFMVEVGDSAPDFTIPDQDENDVSLSSLKGNWVVLYFYPKDDTPGCTKEACGFTERITDFDGLEAKILGVSPDKPAKHRKFIEKYDLKFPLLADTEKEVLEAYGAWGLKKNYGREYMGVIRSTFLIDPDGNIAHRWKSVKVNGHVDKVHDKLEQLKAA